MTTTDTGALPPPKHGYTKDGTPVYARTHRYMKMDTAAQRINAAVGLRITVLVGTMWCAYVFAIIAFFCLPSTIKQHSGTVIVLWISSEFIQLVLLPIIIVGQNIQSRAADARADQDLRGRRRRPAEDRTRHQPPRRPHGRWIARRRGHDHRRDQRQVPRRRTGHLTQGDGWLLGLFELESGDANRFTGLDAAR